MKNICKIFSQTKLTDILYRLLFVLQNFQQDIFENENVILHELLQEVSHMIWLIHGLKGFSKLIILLLP